MPPRQTGQVASLPCCATVSTDEEDFMDETNTINIEHPPKDAAMRMDTIVTKQIAIEGMTCDKCVQTVEKALRGNDGVKEVQVDRGNALATVTFDTTKTDIPALHDALLKAGYHPTARANEG